MLILFVQINNYYNDYANYIHLFVVLHHVVAADGLVLRSIAADFVADD